MHVRRPQGPRKLREYAAGVAEQLPTGASVKQLPSLGK